VLNLCKSIAVLFLDVLVEVCNGSPAVMPLNLGVFLESAFVVGDALFFREVLKQHET
jgi:hypothetical protein